MDVLHSDQGGEFLDEEMKALCNALNLKYTVTTSKTPNANGICERNHFITDHMLDKMLTASPKNGTRTSFGVDYGSVKLSGHS